MYMHTKYGQSLFKAQSMNNNIVNLVSVPTPFKSTIQNWNHIILPAYISRVMILVAYLDPEAQGLVPHPQTWVDVDA